VEETAQPPAGWRTSPGIMPAFVEGVDWAATQLGPRASWSPCLKQVVDLILASAFPMALRWGPDFILIYNDGYRPILGDKHPWALGRPAREAWAEVWGEIEPAHQAILGGETPAIFADDTLLRIQRRGSAWEDARFTLGYSPVPDPSAPTGVGGILVTAVETTERIAAEMARDQAELALRESRAFLADLLKSSGEAFYAVDREGSTTLCNQSFLRQLGFAREDDVIGRKLHDVIHHTHPDGRPYAKENCPIYRCAAVGEPAHVDDESFYRLDGSSFPVEYWVNPVVREGRREGAICTFIDITERRAAQEELRRREAEFRVLAQAAPNHVWASGPDGRLNWFNDRVYAYSGAAPGALDGAGWAQIVHPDDRGGALERWSSSLRTGDIYETEFRLRDAHGAWRWHVARALPVRDTDGAILRWIGANTDIQEQKSATQALATLNATLEQRVTEQAAERDRLWQTSQDLLAVVDAGGVFRAANPAWTAVLGWAISEVVGKPHTRLVHPEDWVNSENALRQARVAAAPPVELRCLHKDGSVRWIAWVAASDNDLIYATGRNVTAEKQAAAELEAAQAALRQSQKMEAVGRLTGGIAHDFNNMLAVVVGSLDLLGRRLGGDERARRYIDAANEGARRATTLTQRLLAFSRQQPLQPERLDANRLVAGMSDLLRHSIGADIRLETVLAGGLWATQADANQLENLVLNLALNARDAMPGGGRLTIETQNAHLDERYAAEHTGVTAGQYVLVAVTDTGVGMSPEVVEKAFDPFFTTKPVGKGTGLGLSQIYGFVKQSGGHAKIYSEPGHGATIKIYLPRDAGTSTPPSGAPAGGEPPMLEGMARAVVLVVEDEPAVRQFSADALRELGYSVLEADGAANALRLLDDHPEIALLFTDVVMPDVNGAKLAAEALRRRPNLRVLYTTGYTRNAVVHNGVLEPGVQMIGKPFTLDALAAKVRHVLGA
jgi:PAS domain S-box-containing protein